ncbi:MAG TPA: glycosyltransferase [Candidatus Saccharimonadia bacterium]|nr:glycosyltransferase [Candidatus Saccharimonadia bacterium]
METTTAAPKKVAVVIPCYNEAASIAEVIKRFPCARLAQHALELKIYVVDNNSSDDTAAIAEQAGATVIYESKKGKGNALRAGFRGVAPDCDYVVMLDGDCTYDPGEIMRVIEPLRSDFCDVVIGSRLGGRIKTAAMSRLHRVGNRLFTGAVRWLYGANVTDVLTGYFAWKKSALDALEPHIKSAGFAVEMEMITKMARLGHQMASVPISYDPRAGESHLRPFYDGSRISLMLLKNLVWRPAKVLRARGEFVPRRLVFVSDTIYPYMKGGKEKRLHEITKRLASMGHEVHIYTMHWWDDPTKARTEDGVQLHALCRHHELYRGDRRAIKEGVMFGLACFKLFWVRFDVLDVDHMPFFPLFSAWIVCAMRGRKMGATWHEALTQKEWIDYMGPGGLIAWLMERISLQLPHSITAASAHTKELLATTHGRARRVELVGSGIDTSLLSTVPRAQIDCDVLYVGRLVKDKHVDQLILAVDIMRRARPEARCVIIGDGIEGPHLRRQVARLGLQANITFLEALPEAADVYSYMKAARVFCSPSVREGFGITVLEALGCGTPVVTVDSPGNAARHLIADGQNGAIVPLTPVALAEAMAYWVAVPNKPDVAARVADYDWRQLAKKQAEVYLQ